jgi:hypothetical protein
MWIAIAKTLNDCFATASRDMFLSQLHAGEVPAA